MGLEHEPPAAIIRGTLDPNLLSACVFCGSLLLRGALTPPARYSAAIAGGYSTFQRENESDDRDRSDVTEKFTAVGLGWARLPAGQSGAATPASEWRLSATFPNSHDEAKEGEGVPDRIRATGGGRYENYSAILRTPLGERNSLEFGFEQRRHKITDLVNQGGSNFQLSGERDLISERIDFQAGARRRWRGLEVAARGGLALIQGKYNTADDLILSRGHLLGGGVEARWQRGAWLASFDAEALSGSLPGSEEDAPLFVSQHTHAAAWTESAALTLQRSIKKTDIELSASLDRSRLPFVTLAVLGAEARAFDSGYHPVSRANDWSVDLAVRWEAFPGVFPRVFFSTTHGTERIALSDRSGAQPDRTIRATRGTGFPGTTFLVGLGAEFSIGNAAPRED
jgi:hypothetical protein